MSASTNLPAKKKNSKVKTSIKAWRLYIVRCSDGSLYTGITNDLKKRIQTHNQGKASRYTRSRLPVKLIYWESCKNKSKALRREYEIKGLERTQKLAIAGQYRQR